MAALFRGIRQRLGIAFVQMLVQRTTELTRRIESFSTDKVARRLALDEAFFVSSVRQYTSMRL
jgi:hypothetical protein